MFFPFWDLMLFFFVWSSSDPICGNFEISDFLILFFGLFLFRSHILCLPYLQSSLDGGI